MQNGVAYRISLASLSSSLFPAVSLSFFISTEPRYELFSRKKSVRRQFTWFSWHGPWQNSVSVESVCVMSEKLCSPISLNTPREPLVEPHTWQRNSLFLFPYASLSLLLSFPKKLLPNAAFLRYVTTSLTHAPDDYKYLRVQISATSIPITCFSRDQPHFGCWYY